MMTEMKRMIVAVAALWPVAATAQTAVVRLDAAEVYCTDAWRNVVSNGVSYQRMMPDHFTGQMQFCRMVMIPLAGPTGNAAAGWALDPATRQTTVWCQATGGSAAGQQQANVRMRFELYGIAGSADDPRCSSDREGRLP